MTRLRPDPRLTPIELEVAQRLATRRTFMNLTQTELGSRAGVSHTIIERYENERGPISVRTLDAVARALDISKAELFGEADRPPNYRASPGEKNVLNLYRRMPTEQQAAVLTLLRSIVADA